MSTGHDGLESCADLSGGDLSDADLSDADLSGYSQTGIGFHRFGGFTAAPPPVLFSAAGTPTTSLRRIPLSLNVPDSLLAKAQHGAISDDEFIECIQNSLPYAWGVIEELAAELEKGARPAVQSVTVPPDEESWGQLFRLVSSDSMRGAVQRRYGVRLAFQNCCKVGLFRPEAEAEYQQFITPQAQILNQNPLLLNC